MQLNFDISMIFIGNFTLKALLSNNPFKPLQMNDEPENRQIPRRFSQAAART